MKKIQYVILTFFCLILLAGVAAAADPGSEAGAGGLGRETAVVPVEDIAQQPAVVSPAGADTMQGTIEATRLATPVLVSPANGAALYHYPRVTTLAWRPVAHANRYKIERAYQSGGNWFAYAIVYTSGNTNTVYSFNFVGDQPGRWRVTAQDTTNVYLQSYPSANWTFTYSTKPTLATPVLTSPVNNTNFYNFPRTTTVAWRPVPGATSYRIERQYYSGGTWSSYPVVTTVGPLNESYTWTFVGMQPGRWRVTALDGTFFYNSPASAYRYFRYYI